MRKKGEVVRAEEFVMKMKKIQEEMKKKADWHRGEAEEYKVGDKVLLSTRDLKWYMVEKRTDKLTKQFVGPYKIKGIILLNTVELELLESVKIHPVVNVSRVCRYREQVAGQKVVLPPPVVIEGKVEKILSKRRRYGKVEYLVHWKGYTAEGDTWEKVENLGNMQEVLKDYKRGYKEAARRIKEEKDSTYHRSELLGKYTAKMLYGWDNRKFEREYLKKLEGNWRQWKKGKFFWRKNLKRGGNVMKQLDPIEELYDMYLEEEDTLRIVEVVDDGLDFDSDNKDRLADLYLKL